MLQITVPEPLRNCCLTLGNFDGVHRGHLQILSAVRRLADELLVPAVAVTFSPHPLALLRPGAAPSVITSIAERTRLLLASGVDQVFVLPVTPQLLQMTAVEFFDSVLLRGFSARGIVEGPNFHFGRGRDGNTALLTTLCQRSGVTFVEVPSLDDMMGMISSSRIRELLGAGVLSEAVHQLGHPLRVTGEVTSGAQRGRTLGFPTANLTGIEGLLPANGVYGGRCEVAGRRFAVAVSIGPNPTFADERQKVECHIVNFSGDLYGQRLAVDLLTEIRPLKSFVSVDELRAQIAADVEALIRRVDLGG
ncbi:MAG: riboflavin biosynthesis protein RibF [Planctomycetaceae bacterium]